MGRGCLLLTHSRGLTRAPHPQTCCQRRQSRGQGSPQVRVGPKANKPEAGGVKILEACRKGEDAQGESSQPGLSSGTPAEALRATAGTVQAADPGGALCGPTRGDPLSPVPRPARPGGLVPLGPPPSGEGQPQAAAQPSRCHEGQRAGGEVLRVPGPPSGDRRSARGVLRPPMEPPDPCGGPEPSGLAPRAPRPVPERLLLRVSCQPSTGVPTPTPFC